MKRTRLNTALLAAMLGTVALVGCKKKDEPMPPPPLAEVDITSRLPIRDAQLTFFITEESPLVGCTVQELALPQDAAVMLIVRDAELVAPRGHTALQVGDHAFVLCHRQSSHAVRKRFAGSST